MASTNAYVARTICVEEITFSTLSTQHMNLGTVEITALEDGAYWVETSTHGLRYVQKLSYDEPKYGFEQAVRFKLDGEHGQPDVYLMVRFDDVRQWLSVFARK